MSSKAPAAAHPPADPGSSRPATRRTTERAETQPPVVDPLFVCDFQPLDDPDELVGSRWSTYWHVERLCRGPEPVPDWVVVARAAVDTELGVLKTGKEADVFLLERAVPSSVAPGAVLGGGMSVVMAAKRYRSEEHRSFHRSSTYTEGRRTRSSRDTRAMAKRTAFGRAVAAGQWANAEWEAMKRFWSAGVPVPYPVQLDGTEILMELVTVDGEVAPRLAQERPGRDRLAAYFEQVREAMMTLAGLGVAHGDLSPYNLLAAGDRIVLIDLPQAVDIVGNPAGMDFLMRDCHNVCSWFVARGLDVDEHALFADLLSAAF